jgi:hypothetical protein
MAGPEILLLEVVKFDMDFDIVLRGELSVVLLSGIKLISEHQGISK